VAQEQASKLLECAEAFVEERRLLDAAVDHGGP
jgi:hypothetical protein